MYGSNRDDRRAMQRALANAGYRVLLASSMAEAAKCLVSHDVRAIVLADASAHGHSEGAVDRAAWRERGIPVIDVVNDDEPLHKSALEIAVLDVARNSSLAAPLAPPPADDATQR